jgi:ActD protein
MAGKKTAVFGIYTDRTGVDRAVEALRAAGFSNNDVSALFPENKGTKDFAHEKNTKAPEGAATGAGTGALLGGGLGWLVGIGALAIPGLGPFIAAGPIMAALAGAGVGGAVGGLTGALIGMGIPEYEAKRYEGRVKDGGILLSVHSDNSGDTKRAKEILEHTGAQDISSTGEARGDKTGVPTREVA